MWLVITEVWSESLGLVTQCRHYNARPIYASLSYVAHVIFFIIECGIVRFLCTMCVFEVRASSSSPRLPCTKFCFFCGFYCWASHGEKSCTQSLTQSLTHSPSLFDAPGTEAFASESPILWFKKLTPILISTYLQEFLKVSHASLLKRLTKTMECTPKYVTKVTVTKNEICISKIQHEKATIQLSSCSECCPLSQIHVLSLGHHWSTALSTMLCFSSALREMMHLGQHYLYLFSSASS